MIFAPGEEILQSSLLRVAWEAEHREFVMYSMTGYRKPSFITSIESVSYVSSPYIPQVRLSKFCCPGIVGIARSGG